MSHVLTAWHLSQAHRREGEDWYPTAHELACELADAHGLDVEQTAGILAVFSPALSWESTIVDTRSYLERGETVYQYGRNLIKAGLIRDYKAYDAIAGPKVRPFWQAICSPWGDSPPVIDRHALSVWAGRTLTDRERKVYGEGSRRAANRIAEVQAAYVETARRVGVHHHVVQATTWIWQRNRGQLSLMESAA